jgi:hypothetical protein
MLGLTGRLEETGAFSSGLPEEQTTPPSIGITTTSDLYAVGLFT